MTDTTVETPWNCLEEHGPGCEDGDPDLVIVLAGLDDEGRRTLHCGGCAEDVVANPQIYPGHVLVPTHTLDADELVEIFGANWEEGNGDFGPEDLIDDCRTECFPDHPGAAILACYVDRNNGGLGLVCTDPRCYSDIANDSERYAMYGTHTLPEWLMDELFPDED